MTFDILVLRLAMFRRSPMETMHVLASPSSTRASPSLDSFRYPITLDTGSLDGKIWASSMSSVTGSCINWSAFIVEAPLDSPN